MYLFISKRYISPTAISQYQEIKLIVKTTRRHMFDARTLHIILRFSLSAISDHHAAVSLYRVSTAVALISRPHKCASGRSVRNSHKHS